LLITIFFVLITFFEQKLSEFIRSFTAVFNIEKCGVNIFFINKIGY